MSRLIVSMWTTVDGYVAGLDDSMDWLRADVTSRSGDVASWSGTRDIADVTVTQIQQNQPTPRAEEKPDVYRDQ